MPSVFRAFSDPAFIPHGYCLSWNPLLVGLHIGSDSLIALSYFSIPVVLVVYAVRRREPVFNPILLLFAAFIVACGMTHLLGVYTLWTPAYWLDGSVKAATALLSVGTAVVLWPMLPKVLAIPSPAALQAEVRMRERTEIELRRSNHELEAIKSRLEREIDQHRQTEQRFQQIFEQAPHAKVMTDAEGRIQLVNGQLLRWFGYTLDEVIGQPVELLIPDRFHSGHPALRQGYMQAPSVRPMGTGRALFGKRKDGSEFPVDIMLSSVDTPVGTQALAAIVDMTEHVRTEQALQRSNDTLGAVNRELETFAYSVSHDLRQPVRALSGFSQILLEDYGPKLDAQARDYLGRIQQAGIRMGQMIEALLGLSRISRSDLDRQPVDIGSLAAEIEEEMRQADPAAAGFQVDIERDLVVQGDPRLLRILLQNLMGNARKFSAQAPKPHIQVGGEVQNGVRAFHVRDNGAGFDMAYVDKLFGVFQRLHRAEEFPGTGIGLATAQRIVSRHGGRIWAEGKVGAGATFYFTL